MLNLNKTKLYKNNLELKEKDKIEEKLLKNREEKKKKGS